MTTEHRQGYTPDAIQNESARKTYQFAERFIAQTGIEATLYPHSGACIDKKSPLVFFKLPDDGVGNELCFDFEGNVGHVVYSRAVAHSNQELVQRADLYTTLQKVTENAGYGFDHHSTGAVTDSIRVQAPVSQNKYKRFAEFLGTIDKVIGLYLKDAKSEN